MIPLPPHDHQTRQDDHLQSQAKTCILEVKSLAYKHLELGLNIQVCLIPGPDSLPGWGSRYEGKLNL